MVDRSSNVNGARSTARPLREMYASRLKKRHALQRKRGLASKQVGTKSTKSEADVLKPLPIDEKGNITHYLNSQNHTELKIDAPKEVHESTGVSPTGSISPRDDLLDQAVDDAEEESCKENEPNELLLREMIEDTIVGKISEQAVIEPISKSGMDPPETRQESSIEVSLGNYRETIHNRGRQSLLEEREAPEEEKCEPDAPCQEPQGTRPTKTRKTSKRAALPSILKKSNIASHVPAKKLEQTVDFGRSPTDRMCNRSRKLEPEPSDIEFNAVEKAVEVLAKVQSSEHSAPRPTVGTTVSMADGGIVPIHEDDENSVVDIEMAMSTSSSPIKLHKLAVPRDTLDYVCECGPGDENDTQLQIKPTKPQDRDVLDYLFECGEEDDLPKSRFLKGRDVRDPSMRAPASPTKQRAAAKSFSYTKSLLDTSSFSTDGGNYDNSRLDSLRNKKRQLERMVVQSNSDDPTILVPRGYREKKTSSSVEVKAKTIASEQDDDKRTNRIRLLIAASLIMGTIGATLILLTFNFFF